MWGLEGEGGREGGDISWFIVLSRSCDIGIECIISSGGSDHRRVMYGRIKTSALGVGNRWFLFIIMFCWDLPQSLVSNDHTAGMVGLAAKWVRLAPNGTNPELFRSGFSAFCTPCKMHWNLIWKSSGFVPFGANLTHFGAKPTIHVLLCGAQMSD